MGEGGEVDKIRVVAIADRKVVVKQSSGVSRRVGKVD